MFGKSLKMEVDEFGREIPAASAANHRSESPPPMHGRPARPRPDSGPRGRGAAPQQPTQQNQHPCFLYVDEPVLCEYLWKEKQQATASPLGGTKEDDKGEDEAKTEATYAAYKSEFCLHYIRAFFNKHMDDSWFRRRFSPGVRKRALLQERKRAVQEAAALRLAVDQDAPLWIQGAGLSHGSKQSATNTVPASHLLSLQQPQSTASGTPALAALHVTDVPPNVTDGQILQTLGGSSSSNAAQLCISSVERSPHTEGRLFLQRSLVVTCADSNILEKVWKELKKEEGTAVPRKDDDQHAMEVHVDCSDPYGRLEYDADGRGGAPADGSAVLLKRAVVLVLPILRHKQERNLVVLSAALSSQRRWAQDRQAASTIARAFDLKMKIPVGHRLDDLLMTLFGEDEKEAESDAAVLDVSLAYLRRVHLFSFYNGCSQATSVGDVLVGKHATIHLRLHKADELLDQHHAPQSQQTQHSSPQQPVKEEETDEVAVKEEPTQDGDATPLTPSAPQNEPKDMLVQRLDDSIAKALLDCQEWLSHNGGDANHQDGGDEDESNIALMERQDEEDATQIDRCEESTEDKWLQDHAILDEDGRARCSFHFCHKLFKDRSFLHKHLLKKHVEFLRAEQAKCHDDAMMKAWDACSERPVPDLLVDCGHRFGWVAVPVKGESPDCVDPEPDLWQREEEMRQRKAEMRAQREQERDARERELAAAKAEIRSASFVDVDDMKVEKVEVSFDNIIPDASLAATKKKKKKRKLL